MSYVERNSFDNLPEGDIEHLSLDIKRVFNRLVPEWIEYMRHLKEEYPYFFSLAVRTNPFTARQWSCQLKSVYSRNLSHHSRYRGDRRNSNLMELAELRRENKIGGEKHAVQANR